MFFRRLPSFPPPGGEGAQHSGTKARAEARPVDPVPDKARDREAASAIPPAASPIAARFAKAEQRTPPPHAAGNRCVTSGCRTAVPDDAFYCHADDPARGGTW